MAIFKFGMMNLLFVFIYRLCTDEDCADVTNLTFNSCNPKTFALQSHTIVFDGGEIVLQVRIGESLAGTQPGAFVRASGTLDGEDFLQESYWKLIYNPEHHHFLRDFAVLFDTSIGDACGLKVINVEPWESVSVPAEVSTIDCDLGDLESRALVSQSFEQP
jgi:hypothetical protein